MLSDNHILGLTHPPRMLAENFIDTSGAARKELFLRNPGKILKHYLYSITSRERKFFCLRVAPILEAIYYISLKAAAMVNKKNILC